MKKILVVEDEVHISELIKYNLETNGYTAVIAQDGEEAIQKVSEDKPDLVLLDVMLPKMDGLEVCTKIRNKIDEDIPIVMLTAKSEELDVILGLEMGADDYILKPFSVKEMLARIKSVLRRYDKTKSDFDEEVYQVDDVTINMASREVLKNGETIHLTYKEFELFTLLLKNKGKVIKRDYLLNKIWGYDYFGETRTVDVHVRNIRKKLGFDESDVIETIRGVGYKLK